MGVSRGHSTGLGPPLRAAPLPGRQGSCEATGHRMEWLAELLLGSHVGEAIRELGKPAVVAGDAHAVVEAEVRVLGR